jgi:hypothetical protein
VGELYVCRAPGDGKVDKDGEGAKVAKEAKEGKRPSLMQSDKKNEV